MKKFFKTILFVLIAVLTIGVGFANPLMAFAYSERTHVQIEAVIPKDIALNENLIIDRGKADSVLSDILKVKITDPNKIVKIYNPADVDDNIFEAVSGDDTKFKLKKVVPGTYNIEYYIDDFYDKPVYFSTPSYTFEVTTEKYTLSFASNSPIIPDITNLTKEITLPTPQVLDKDDELIDVSDYTGKGISIDYVVKKTYSKEGTTETVAVPVTGGKFKPDTVGTYTITYKLTINGNVLSTKSFSMVVKSNDDFNSTRDIKMTDATWEFSFPTKDNIKINKEFTLPKLIVKNNGATHKTNAVVKIWKSGNEANKTTVNNYKHTITTAGTYYVSYELTDFFGNKYETQTKVIENVVDDVAPEVSMVADYNIANVDDADFKDTVVNNSFKLRSHTAKKDIIFPAIYAYDLVSDYSDITFARTLRRKSDGTTWVIGEGAADNEKVTFTRFNEDANFEEGEYEVLYTATDANNNKGTFRYPSGVTPTIYIYAQDAYTDNNPPVIESFEMQEYMYTDEEITFDLPVIKDFDADDTNKEIDSDIETHIYWFYGTGNDTDFENAAIEKHEILKDKDGKYILKLEGYTNQDKVGFVITAEDDYSHVTKAYKTIKVINTADNDPVKISTDTTDVSSFSDIFTDAYKQNDEIGLPEMIFFDKSDENLEVTIAAYNRNGEKVPLTKGYQTYDRNFIFEEGVTGTGVHMINYILNAVLDGEYAVIYSAKDASGHITSYCEILKVATSTKPVITNIGASTVTINLGETITLPSGTLYMNGVVDTSAVITMKVVSDLSYIQAGNRLKPLAVGEYRVYYDAEVGDPVIAAERKEKIINVIDSTAPVITVNDTLPDKIPLNEPCELPNFTVEDIGGVATKEVIVKNKYNNEVDVTFDEAIQKYVFTPNINGKHTVIYKATDAVGNKTSETEGVTLFYIQAGDITPPTITVTAGSIPTKVKKDGSLTISRANILAEDIGYDGKKTTLLSSDVEITLSHETSGPVEGVVEDTSITYSLKDVGTYTLTMRISDGNNETVKTFEIVVESTDKKPTLSDDTLGLILIIVSLVLLCGVIVYFILTGKKKPTNRPPKSIRNVQKNDQKSLKNDAKLIENDAKTTENDTKTDKN